MPRSGAYPSPARDRTEQEQEKECAEERDQDLHHDVCGRDAKHAGQKATDYGPEDANDDVPDEAHAVTREHLARQEPGDEADDDEDEDSFHVSLLRPPVI